jgi:hypothetical protein
LPWAHISFTANEAPTLTFCVVIQINVLPPLTTNPLDVFTLYRVKCFPALLPFPGRLKFAVATEDARRRQQAAVARRERNCGANREPL